MMNLNLQNTPTAYDTACRVNKTAVVVERVPLYSVDIVLLRNISMCTAHIKLYPFTVNFGWLQLPLHL